MSEEWVARLRELDERVREEWVARLRELDERELRLAVREARLHDCEARLAARMADEFFSANVGSDGMMPTCAAVALLRWQDWLATQRLAVATTAPSTTAVTTAATTAATTPSTTLATTAAPTPSTAPATTRERSRSRRR